MVIKIEFTPSSHSPTAKFFPLKKGFKRFEMGAVLGGRRYWEGRLYSNFFFQRWWKCWGMRTSTTSMNVRRKLPKNSSRYIQLLQVIIVGKFGLTHNFTHNFTQLYPLLRPTLPSFTQLYPLLHTTLPITSHNSTHYFTPNEGFADSF